MYIRMIVIIFSLFFFFQHVGAEAGTVRDAFKEVKETVLVILTEEQFTIVDDKKVSAQGLGSGFLISEDGKVMTAAHVVQTSSEVEVMFPDKELVPAKVISSEPAADVALLQLDRVPKGAKIAKLGDSDEVEVGDEVFVVGAPYGLSYTLTVGHISARHDPHTVVGQMALAEFFQTDAAVNQGNSGGPMFNMQGEVIGVVSHILSQSGGFEGLGFVVTTKTAEDILLKQRTGWSGMQSYMLQGGLADIFNLPQKKGMLVQRIAPGSPAERIGLVESNIPVKIGEESFMVGGDIILGIDGISLAETNGYVKIKNHLNNLPKGSKVTLQILRAGIKRELTFKKER